MNAAEIRHLTEKQRRFFKTGTTLPVEKRIQALKRLRQYILRYQSRIEDAIRADLGKSSFESYMVETGMVLSEIRYLIRHVPSFAREKTVWTPLAQFCSRSYTKPSPHGVVLIMSPWNYPFMLSLEPLADAIAAGNTVILKPSAYSPATSAVMKEMLEDCFADEFVAVVTGGREENQALLNEHFDYIFFTGSQQVGKVVMQKAAEHLTPVTLELGGKSPCIVDETASLRLAARRIVFGKFLNLGQTCVAPDYCIVHESVKDAFLLELIRETRRQFRDTSYLDPDTHSIPGKTTDYGKIISEKHFNRILSLIDPEKVVCGGRSNPETLQIEPTILDNVTFSDPVMGEEIFGPVLPVLTYTDEDELIHKLNSLPHPLALYIFSNRRSSQKKFISRIGFGGGCINDVVIHLATSEMSFGGFGESGMGGYHGKTGLETFSHRKSIVDKKTFMDLPMRYQPYRRINSLLIHLFLR